MQNHKLFLIFNFILILHHNQLFSTEVEKYFDKVNSITQELNKRKPEIEKLIDGISKKFDINRQVLDTLIAKLSLGLDLKSHVNSYKNKELETNLKDFKKFAKEIYDSLKKIEIGLLEVDLLEDEDLLRKKIQNIDDLLKLEYFAKTIGKQSKEELLKSMICLTDILPIIFITAAKNGDLEQFNELIESGAVNIDYKDENGFTALMRAAQGDVNNQEARENKKEILKMLLKMKANTNLQDNIMKLTALGWAKLTPNNQEIEIILEDAETKE